VTHDIAIGDAVTSDGAALANFHPTVIGILACVAAVCPTARPAMAHASAIDGAGRTAPHIAIGTRGAIEPTIISALGQAIVDAIAHRQATIAAFVFTAMSPITRAILARLAVVVVTVQQREGENADEQKTGWAKCHDRDRTKACRQGGMRPLPC